MRKIGYVVLCLAGMVLVCGLGVGGEETGKASRTGTLEHQIALDVEYPITGQGKVDRLIQNWLEKRLERTLRSFSGVRLDPDITESKVTLSVNYRETNPSDRAVSYIFDVYSYPFRAAHPMSKVHVLSVDLDRRERIDLESIFAHPKRALKIMAEKAPEAVRKELVERLDGQVDEEEVSSALFMEGFEPNADNYAALALEPNGVRVIFQLYQVAPYVYGKPEAFIPLSDFEEAGPRRELWGK